jgi:NNP family nitrate/nitrite transporter-like MFS transporter
VGAGGDVGSVMASFLFKGAIPWTQALFFLGAIVTVVSLFTIMVPFSEVEENSAESEISARLAGRFAVAEAIGD